MLVGVAVVAALMSGVTQIDPVSVFRTCFTPGDCEIFQAEQSSCSDKQLCTCATQTFDLKQCFARNQAGVTEPSVHDRLNIVWAMSHGTFIPPATSSFTTKRIVNCGSLAAFERAYLPQVQSLLPREITNLEIKIICYTSGSDSFMKSMVKFDAPASLLFTSGSSDSNMIRRLATNLNSIVLKESQTNTDLYAGGHITHAHAATVQALAKCAPDDSTILSVSFSTDASLTNYLEGTLSCNPMICKSTYRWEQTADGGSRCIAVPTAVPTTVPTTNAPSPDDVTRSVTVEVTVTGELTELQAGLSVIKQTIGTGLGNSEPAECVSVCRRSLRISAFYDSECFTNCATASITTNRGIQQLAARRWRFRFTGSTSYTHELVLKRINNGLGGVLGSSTLNLLEVVEPKGYRDFSDDELSGGAIAGIVIGGTLFLCFVTFIVYKIATAPPREELNPTAPPSEETKPLDESVEKP